jgi:hypothetical protein
LPKLHPFVLVILSALMAASCARQESEPVRHVAVDIRLPLEFETIQARVPAHATLDGLLRQNHLQESW